MNTTTGQQIATNDRSLATPRYLTRYAADVDQWHTDALAARSAS